MNRLILFLLLLCSTIAKGTTYYVAASGNDSNNGTSISTPWKTLTKVNATWYSVGDVILFNCGDEFYGYLNLKNNGGSSGSPIKYGAYGTGSKPIITGFTTLSSWTDEGGGVFSKTLTSDSQTNMVTIDGIQYAMGRYPNSTTLTYESFSTNTSITDTQLTGTPNWSGAEAVIYKNGGYDIDRCLITGHSVSTLTYTNLGTTSPGSNGSKYFIQNDLRTLDQFGEWYHDTTAGKLYVFFGANSPDSYVIKVATKDNLVYAGSGEDYIEIDNINFSGSIKDAIYLSWADDNCKITNCDINFSGLTAIRVSGASDIITGNNVNNCNRIGIHCDVSNFTVSSNTIKNVGVLVGQGSIGQLYRGAILTYRNTGTINNNIIENTGFSSLILDGATSTGNVLYNYIKNVCLLASDQAAVYLYGAKTAIRIENNIIIGSGGSGIYLDEVTTNTKVKNNIIQGCSYYGIKLHKGHDNTVSGNTCYDNAYALDLENWVNTRYLYNDSIFNNVFVAKTITQKAVFMVNWYNDNNIGVCFNNHYARPLDDNLIFYTNLASEGNVYSSKNLSQWKTLIASDSNSLGSLNLISSVDELYFGYNSDLTDKTIQLPFKYKDFVTSATYNSEITLRSFTSAVLVKDLTVTPPETGILIDDSGHPLTDESGNPLIQ